MIAVVWGLCAVLAAGQGEGGSFWRELDAEVVRLREELATADPFAREALLRELEQAEPLLREAEREDPSRRDVQLTLYKLLAARAEYDDQAPLATRLEHFDGAIAAADACGLDEPRGRSRLIRAETLLRSGRYEEAHEALLRIFEEVPGMRLTRAFAEFVLAETQARLGLYAEAMDTLERAQGALEDGPVWDRLAGRIEGARGQIYLDLGRPDRAARSFAREGAALEALGVPAAMIWKDLVAADLHATHLALAEGRYADAARATAAIETLFAGPAAGWRAILLAVRAEALGRLAEMGRAETAEACALFEEALAGDLPEYDRLLAEVRLARLRTAEGALEASAALLGRARERLDRMRRDRRSPLPEEALFATERARLTLARGGSTDELAAAFDALGRAFDERLSLWQATPLLPGGLGFLHHPARRAWLGALTRLALAVEDEATAGRRILELWMRAQAQGVLVRGKALPVGTAAEVQRELCGPRQGIVSLLPGPDVSFAVVADRAAIEVVELPPSHELEALRAAALTQKQSDANGAAWHALARVLLPPSVAQRVRGWDGLHLVGFDLLGPLPFERLPFGSGELGTERAVAYLPSLSLGLSLVRASAPPTGDPSFLLVAAPTVAPELAERLGGLEPLGLSEAELAALGAGYGERRVLRATQAGAAELARALPTARLVQFFCHSVQLEEADRPAHLVLAGSTPEDLLSCEAVEGLSAPELVLLTACRAGLGPPRRGDAGMGHMGGAWLAAGARAVLLSREDLFLRPTVSFSSRYHAALLDGASPAEALRRVRVAVRREEGEAAYRALDGLHLLGLGSEPLVPVSAGRSDDVGRGRGPVLARARSGQRPLETGSRQALLVAAGSACSVLAFLAALLSRRLARR